MGFQNSDELPNTHRMDSGGRRASPEIAHSSREHSALSASGAKRWMNCTPSARIEERFPNESSVYAEEGTAAHELGEYKIRKYLHERVRRPKSDFDNEEMENCTDIYAEHIATLIGHIKEACPNPLVMIEERLDFSHIVPDGFGTGDCVIIADGTLYVVDYKHGRGIFVSCDHNPQMMLYAVGALHMYGYLYDIKRVSMTIVQPRLENISTFECGVEELTDWAENYVKPRAVMAYEGRGEQMPGEWCRFCRAKAVCRACAEEALSLAREEFLDLDAGILTDDADSQAEETDATAAYNRDNTAPTFKSPALLDKHDIEIILPTLNRISSWIEAVFAFVSSEAINHGVCWDGYKVVEGRSKRQFIDPKSVAEAAAKAGYTDIYKTEMISLTEFEKLMGKKTFKEILGEFVVKPPGKLSLVPDSDPRQAVDLETVADEFNVLD